MKYSNGEGNVFVVTGNSPADGNDTIALEQSWQLQKRVTINIILRNPSKLYDYFSNAGPNPPAQIAQRTGGQVFFVQTDPELANVSLGL
jgi:hypothetical protein